MWVKQVSAATVLCMGSGSRSPFPDGLHVCREDRKVGVWEALTMLFEMLWQFFHQRVERLLGSSTGSPPLSSDAAGPEQLTDATSTTTAEDVIESLEDGVPSLSGHQEL